MTTFGDHMRNLLLGLLLGVVLLIFDGMREKTFKPGGCLRTVLLLGLVVFVLVLLATGQIGR
ncbi:MAG: hypothetical protein R3C14_09550 [Caldilineaceae bacterium]